MAATGEIQWPPVGRIPWPPSITTRRSEARTSLELENSTLCDGRTSFAASRLRSSQNLDLDQQEPGQLTSGDYDRTILCCDVGWNSHHRAGASVSRRSHGCSCQAQGAARRRRARL